LDVTPADILSSYAARRGGDAPPRNKIENSTFRCGAIVRRSQRRLSRIANGLWTRCYSPLALARIAKGDGRHTSRPIGRLQTSDIDGSRPAMEDPYHDLVLAMLTLAIAAVLLVAGGLYLMTRPDPSVPATPALPIITSSIFR
jgi:hypothetical protein